MKGKIAEIMVMVLFLNLLLSPVCLPQRVNAGEAQEGECRITYVLNGGTNYSANPVAYNPGEKAKLYKASKMGYKFTGWYTTSDFARGTKLKSISSKCTGDLTLYAQYKPYKYTVIYNWGDKSIKKLKHTGSIEESLHVNEYKRPGYSFAGWKVNKNGTGKTIKDGSSFWEIFKVSPKKKITLYASWVKATDVPEATATPTGPVVPGVTATPTATATVIVEDAIHVVPYGDNPEKEDGSEVYPYIGLQKALDNVKAGQTIYMHLGVYSGENILKTSGSEKEGFITITAYPGDTAVLSLNQGASGAIFDINGQSYVKIENLDMGWISGETVYGILMHGGEDNIYIENNKICEIVTTKPNGSGESNAILCLGEGTTKETAIRNIYIKNNQIYNNVNGWSENISIAGNCENVIVEGNTIKDCTNIGIDFYGNAGYCSNPDLDQPRNCKAINNTVTNCVCSYADCAGIYVDGAHDIEIIGNHVYGNQYGIEVGSEEAPKNENGTVRNINVEKNEICDNTVTGLMIGGYTKDSKTGVVKDVFVQNNLFSDNGVGSEAYNGEICFAKCDGITIKSNKICKLEQDLPYIGAQMNGNYAKNLSFSNNVYMGYIEPDPDYGAEDIYFELPIGTIKGLNAFNALDFVTDESYSCMNFS